ncbi:MAG: DUF3828 domain-containing protein [Pyrinomonadaceae bacterium]
MRHRRLTLAAFLVVAAASATSGQTAKAPQPAAGPQETVSRFYAWYLHRLNKEDYDPLKNRTVALKYLTPEFLRRVPRLVREMEADIIVCSQDVNPVWEKSFKAELASSSGARATVLVALDRNEVDTIKLKLTLKRTRAGWRIDGADCGE